MKKNIYSISMLMLSVNFVCLDIASQQNQSAETRQLIAILEEAQPVRLPLSTGDAQAKNKSAALIRLLQLNQGTHAWPYLALSSNPDVRSYFIRDAGKSGLPVGILLNRIPIEKNVSIRRSLILSLGSYSSTGISLKQRKELIPQLLRLYRTDPDAGIHSAIDWLLRYGQRGQEARSFDWMQQKQLLAIDSALAGQSPSGKSWYVSKTGHTFSVIKGPVTFTMGSAGNEPGRDKGPMENQHRQNIPRSFAIAIREVTVRQFQEFLDSNPGIKQLAAASGGRNPIRSGQLLTSRGFTDDCPQISMTWFEAAQYCNWLSQQEGIPEDEWCYPSLEQIKEGMTLAGNYLQRSGYRLPTEAEFEYACRSGTSTSRFFGTSEELLREYSWFTGNSFNEKPWPVGQLKPNDFGLFDVYGNVWEWGQDLVKQYVSERSDTVWVDTEDTLRVVSKNYKRPRKGGSYSYNADFHRSAYRNEGYIPDERRDNVGFRIARTIKEK